MLNVVDTTRNRSRELSHSSDCWQSRHGNIGVSSASWSAWVTVSPVDLNSVTSVETDVAVESLNTADATATGPVLSELLGLHPGANAASGPCTWLMGSLSVAAVEDLESAARILAERAMRMRCGDSTAYGLWVSRVNGAPPLTPTERLRVEPFIETVFGLPGKTLSPEHIQGYVAELLWHTLASESQTTCGGLGKLHHLEDPSFSVTEPGGDGLAVYELADGILFFRLWEVKKHSSKQHVSATVTSACNQLSTRATKYLAKYSALSRNFQGPLRELYAELVDLWIDADPRAGLGVSVATSAASAPKGRGFSQMGRKFPKLTTLGQREGMLIAVGNFPAFADMVKEAVWKGL